MQIVAATWYVYSQTGSAAAVGVLSALALGPAIVGAPFGGALADRHDPRRLAILLSVLQAVPAALMAASDLAGVLSVPLLYLFVFAGAVPFSVNQPIITLVVPYTVEAEYRQAAVARASMAFNVTRLVGAVVGGYLVDALGVGAAFAFNAASYLLVAAVLWGTRLVAAPETSSVRAPDQGLRVGIRTGWRHRLLRLAALGVIAFFTLVAPIEQLMPTVAQEHGFDASDVGILIAAIATGALLANPMIGGRNNSRAARRRLMAMGLFLSAPGMILLGLTPEQGLAVDVVAAMLIGFGWEFVFVSGQSTVAVDAPSHLRGRMMGLFFVLVTATTALGAVTVGLVLDRMGMATAFLINAAIVIGAGLVLWTRAEGADGTDMPGNREREGGRAMPGGVAGGFDEHRTDGDA